MTNIQYANFATANAKEGYAILKRSIFANAVISEINLWTSSLEDAIGYCEENASANEWITILCDWNYSEHSNLEFELLVGKY